jgi:2-hydroxychromene-2-carboxylate isomerase
MPAIRFFFDFLSPYAYLAHQQLPAMAARHGYDVELCPVDLQTLKTAAGNTGPSNRQMPIKHRHLRVDLQRWAQHYGVPLVPPAGYGSTRLNRGTFFALDRGVGHEYVTAAWRRVWGQGGAMDDDALIADVARDMQWVPGEFMDYTVSAPSLERYEQSIAAARDTGVFGVPSMVVDGQMWWGNDRLHFLEEHLRQGEHKQ